MSAVNTSLRTTVPVDDTFFKQVTSLREDQIQAIAHELLNQLARHFLLASIKKDVLSYPQVSWAFTSLEEIPPPIDNVYDIPWEGFVSHGGMEWKSEKSRHEYYKNLVNKIKSENWEYTEICDEYAGDGWMAEHLSTSPTKVINIFSSLLKNIFKHHAVLSNRFTFKMSNVETKGTFCRGVDDRMKILFETCVTIDEPKYLWDDKDPATKKRYVKEWDLEELTARYSE